MSECSCIERLVECRSPVERLFDVEETAPQRGERRIGCHAFQKAGETPGVVLLVRIQGRPEVWRMVSEKLRYRAEAVEIRWDIAADLDLEIV